MRITDARVITTCPGRNFVTLKIVTDQGLHGVGDATLNGRELAVAAYLQDHVAPLLIGRDAHRIEDTWHLLYQGAYWRGGPVTMTAIAAVDVALWDLKAKAAGLPLYQLLGGACRDGVMVYGHANGATIEETADAVAEYLALGYKAVRVQTGIPGLGPVYGVGKGKLFYEPADPDRPSEETWDSAVYLDHLPRLFERLRERFGFNLHLLHDVHHRLTPMEAARLGRSLEPYRLFWLEDVTPAENPDKLRLIRQHTVTPLAIGEIFNTVFQARPLIEQQLIDFIRCSPVHAGGLTHLRRIADLAALYQIRTGCHGPTDVSPIGLAATLHFDLAVPSFGLQEYMRHTDETDAVFPHAYRYADGSVHPGEAPGHGADIDEAAAARFPYRRAYLPVARLHDGTVWHW